MVFGGIGSGDRGQGTGDRNARTNEEGEGGAQEAGDKQVRSVIPKVAGTRKKQGNKFSTLRE